LTPLSTPIYTQRKTTKKTDSVCAVGRARNVL
jgi:hypothetical protein